MASWDERIARTSYRFMRVSRATGEEVERIPALKGGTITRNDDVRIKENAEASLVGSYDFGPDLVRVWMDCEWAGGNSASVVLGTFLPVLPSRSVNSGYSKASLKMYGRLQELLDDKYGAPVTVPRGSNAVAYARAVCEQAGLEVVADPSDYQTTDTRYYGIGAEQSNSSYGDTKLDMVNDLLDLAGFRAAHTDSMGRVLLEKYVAPEDIVPAQDFVEGPDAKFESSMTDERDYTSTANHVVVRYGGTDGKEAVVGEAYDTDPSSDLSTVSRGRVITKGYTYNDLPPGSTAQERQDYATKRAQTLLGTAQSVIRRIKIRTPYHPATVNDVISMRFPSGGIDGRFQIRAQTLSLTGGCPTETEARNFWRRTK